MTELLRRALRRLANATESAFVASGTATGRQYAPLAHSSRRA
jgi:hypothetical protein